MRSWRRRAVGPGSQAVRPAVDATLPQLLLGKVAGGRMGCGPRQYSRTVCATVTENLI